MTVAIGLACPDGALLATDSMGMSGRIASNITKIRPLGAVPGAWTFAGSTYVANEVDHHLSQLGTPWTGPGDTPWSELTATQVKTIIEEALRPVITSAYERLTPPPGGKVTDHSADFLIATWTRPAGGVLVRLFPDTATMLNDGPMLTMGYGHEYATVAQGLLNHHLKRVPALDDATLIAHRTISAVCEVSSGGVGGPVQLATVNDQGSDIMDIDAVDAIATAVDRWKSLELEALQALRSGGTLTASDPENDLPDLNSASR